ncbi:MAG: DUF5343 domain-containing protein [Hyphomicrobiales bacterium]|nr:DUF5343 domain-containing protein [Hyphomicrobiales bacterium]
MSEKLPFINSYGLVFKILNKIIEAQTPPKYTQDFQSTVIGYGSGSARPFIPLLKKIDFLQSDGTPTELYKKFRNDSFRGQAMAEAIKIGYAPLYKINEYAHELEKSKLKDAVIQVTGFDKTNSTVKAIVGTFEALKDYADFDITETEHATTSAEDKPEVKLPSQHIPQQPQPSENRNRGMNLSYTINLNLPASKDSEVFDAIFKSLKENLLGD